MTRPLTTSPMTLPKFGARLLGSIFACSMLIVPATAFGLGEYRDAVAGFAKVPNDSVQCGYCHDDPRGGGVRNQPFFVSLTANGLESNKFETLAPALENLKSKGVDSDGDAAGDIAELTAQTNPNDANDKPAPTGGSGGSPPQGGQAGQAPAPAGRAGAPAAGRGGAAGRAGSATAASDGGDDQALAPGASASTCSYGPPGPANGAGLLAALATLLVRRARRARGTRQRP